jgi:hypothetical protein
MSTITILKVHEDAKPPRLERFLPTFVGREREIRCVSMLPSLHEWLHGSAKTQRMRDLKAGARIHFGEFVKENKIDDCRYMKLVEDRRPGNSRFAHGVWSVRPLFEPQHRFFGVFAVPDWFLVLRKQLRSNLAKGGDTAWHAELDKTLLVWRKLFPGLNVYTGTQLAHYITRNAEHCDERWY